MRKVAARAEDVGLVVANSVAVFYYLWRILNAEHQQAQAIAAATVGMLHLLLLAVVIIRCRQDRALQAAMGVLGTAFITAAIPLYFSRLNPMLLSWSLEAVVLTFIGIRYRSLWTKAMALIVSAIAAVGLFYHLPLHGQEAFRIVFNAPFGTWLFVTAAIMVCHLLWRFLSQSQDAEGRTAAQVYYIAGVVLLAIGCAMEWFAFCDRVIEVGSHSESTFLQGMMVIVTGGVAALLFRPWCPQGVLTLTAGMLAAFFGAVFAVVAIANVYVAPFRLFINVPFGLACGDAAVVGLAAYRLRQPDPLSPLRRQLAAALGVMVLGLVFVLLAGQGYFYWYCQNAYVQPRVNWQGSAAYTIALCWAVYGLVLLAAALRFDKLWLKALAVLTAAASIAAIVLPLPLHFGGDFRLMLNLPFTAWLTVAAALIASHGLWRMAKVANQSEARLMAQVYYAAGVLLAAVGWAMEWYAHCRWHVEGETGDAHFLLGTILLLAAVTLTLLARPLSPDGNLVRTLGVLVSLFGAAFVIIAQSDVHTAAFRLFANMPFAIAMVFVTSMAAAAGLLRCVGCRDPKWKFMPLLLTLAVMLLVWGLLSQEVYYYWACCNQYAGPVNNWLFSAQMFMSITWAIYAAALMVGGFVFRQRGVRYLSMGIFAALLAKIFLIDTTTVRVEYRIAAFLTTGLILVGVSFAYQFLKKKGFFEEK